MGAGPKGGSAAGERVDRVALDTTFLIDLQNERRRRGPSRRAKQFLEEHRETRVVLPAIALGEYLEGFDDPMSPAARALGAPRGHPSRFRRCDGIRTSRPWPQGAKRGELIGANDLWIACTALALGVPIVTRNIAHFERVEGLQVVSYHC